MLKFCSWISTPGLCIGGCWSYRTGPARWCWDTKHRAAWSHAEIPHGNRRITWTHGVHGSHHRGYAFHGKARMDSLGVINAYLFVRGHCTLTKSVFLEYSLMKWHILQFPIKDLQAKATWYNWSVASLGLCSIGGGVLSWPFIPKHKSHTTKLISSC